MAAFAATAGAQRTSVELPTTVIESQEEGSSTTQSFQIAKQELRGIPGGVGIIDNERLLAGKASNQEDLLKYTPGVWVANQNGGDDVFLSIRGSNLSNRSFGRGNISMLDGAIPLSQADGGTNNQLTNILAMDYVEVYRGGNALTLGATTIGGVINYVPRTGYTADKLRVRLEGGSDEYSRGQVAISDVVGDLDYFASLEVFGYDGFRDQGKVSNYRFHGNIGKRLGDDAETRFYFLAAKAYQELPGVISKQAAGMNPKQAGFFNSFLDTDRNFDDYRIANKTTIRGSDSELVVSAFVFLHQLDHLPTPFTGIIDNEALGFGARVQYTKEGELFGKAAEFTTGLNLAHDSGTDKRFRYVQNGRAKGIETLDADIKATNLELFAQETVSLTDNLDLIAGFQAVHTTRDYDDNTLLASPPAIPPFPPQVSARPGDQSFDEDYSELNPRVGITYDLNEDSLLFAGLSRSSGFPSETELSNNVNLGAPTNVDPMTALTLEVGARGNYGQAVNWDVTLFRSEVKDEILFQMGPFPNTTVIDNFDTIHQGLELGGSIDFLAWGISKGKGKKSSNDNQLRLDLVYNYFDFEFDDDSVFGNGTLPNIPEHSGFTSLEYWHSSGFYFGPNVRFWDDYGTTFDNTGGSTGFGIPGAAVFGARGGYRGDTWSFFVDARNITDKEYIATASPVLSGAGGGSINVTPGDDTTIVMGLEYRR